MGDRSLRLLHGEGIEPEPPSTEALIAGIPCCSDIREALADGRPSIRYQPEIRTVWLSDALPSSGMLLLAYCPFCGTALLPSLNGVRDEVAIEAGLDPYDDEQRPEVERRFGTDVWWRSELERDPAAFVVELPEPGDVLVVGEKGTRVIVVAVHPRHQFESFLIAPLDSLAQIDLWLAITSTRAYSQRRWPVAARDVRLAAALAARLQLTSSGGWPASSFWQMEGAGVSRGAGRRLTVVELQDELFSIEIERALSAGEVPGTE